MSEKLDLETACNQEAERRLKLLGDLADAEYDYDQLRKRAREVGIPFKALREWWLAYQEQGLQGLIPQDWTELDEETQHIVEGRYNQLGELADAETVTPDQVAQLADQNEWSRRTTGRWLRRYRVGGLWALAPHNNPRKRRRAQKPPRDLSTLDEAALETTFERRAILGVLAGKASLANEEVNDRAQEIGVSPRTIRSYHSGYRRYGLAGLAPRERSDKGSRHGISDRMTQIVVGIRLSNKNWGVSAVYSDARKKARALGEVEPSRRQVAEICKSIPEPVLLLADGQEDELRNRFGFTHRISFSGSRIIYQVDHTLVDVLVRDIRSQKHQTPSEEVRPWLTLIVDSSSRLVMAAQFGYDRPNRFTVAAAIRDALLVSEQKPFGGIPDELWVDRGKELLSDHVSQLAGELGITLYPCPAHQPQIKGIVERFFGTLNTRLWSTLPGYVGSNTAERNPSAKAELTISELVEVFREFIIRYHNEMHSQTGKTPLEYWNECCFAETVDPRHLDILLMERESRRVIKTGIKYKSRLYWHTALARLVGEDVLVRAGPSYAAPDDIQVYYDGRWICTAFATDSDVGLLVTKSEVSAAKCEQTQAADQMIDEACAALKEAEQEIEEQTKSDETPDTTPESPQPVAQEPEESRKTKESAPDLLDRLAGLAGGDVSQQEE